MCYLDIGFRIRVILFYLENSLSETMDHDKGTTDRQCWLIVRSKFILILSCYAWLFIPKTHIYCMNQK
jgi:hypothetical protein